ncbi:MAG: hypothetical protein ACJ71R_17015 [Nitrososphaeraceae archaeon]
MEKNERHERHQNESITFRLDSIILNKLHREAEQKDISVNTLVSHIIRRHIDWHSNAAKAGFITVRRGLLSNLINRLLYKHEVNYTHPERIGLFTWQNYIDFCLKNLD